MLRFPSSDIALHSGDHIAVIGGGPAGSSFALFALHYAQQAGLDLHVTIFEPRHFGQPGPLGCNMCAGLIPVRMLECLAKIGVVIPEHFIRNRISTYTLHTTAGQICIPQPDPNGEVVSVYRGSGPRGAPPWPHRISFDGFLLDMAQSRGAKHVRQRVTAIELKPRPRIETRKMSVPADLVVFAVGVNRSAVHFTDLTCRFPPRSKMAHTEICLESEAVQAALGDSVHIFLPSDNSLKFGTLVPKGPCISVSLLGEAIPPGSVAQFLTLPEVADLLPLGWSRACNCRPHIAEGMARPLYADRFVAIGDAGVTQLYKNGIGTALHTARQAAKTAVQQGTSKSIFAAHYAPLCRQIAIDNSVGRFLFFFRHIFQRYPRISRAQINAIASEQKLPPEQRLLSRLLWGMFTGVYPYRRLLAMACHPSLHLRLSRQLFGRANQTVS